MSVEPVWLSPTAMALFHAEMLADRAQESVLRDEGLFLSAMARPMNAWSFGERDHHFLAALYAHGLVSNHPFVDGNKRAGFIAATAFLELNGKRFEAAEADAAATTIALASGELDVAGYAAWLRENSTDV